MAKSGSTASDQALRSGKLYYLEAMARKKALTDEMDRKSKKSMEVSTSENLYPSKENFDPTKTTMTTTKTTKSLSNARFHGISTENVAAVVAVTGTVKKRPSFVWPLSPKSPPKKSKSDNNTNSSYIDSVVRLSKELEDAEEKYQNAKLALENKLKKIDTVVDDELDGSTNTNESIRTVIDNNNQWQFIAGIMVLFFYYMYSYGR